MQQLNMSYRRQAQRTRLLPVVALLLGLAFVWPLVARAQEGEPAPAPDAPLAEPLAPVFDPTAEEAMPPEELSPDEGAAPDGDSAAEEGILDEQLMAETGATCRQHGMQVVEIAKAWTAWVSAVNPDRPQSGQLLAGIVASGANRYPLWTLAKFNYNNNDVPRGSELCSAQILLTKSNARGTFSPVAYAMNSDWPSNATYNGVRNKVGSYIGAASNNDGTIRFNASSYAFSWLKDPRQNHGFVVQSNGGANQAVLRNPRLLLTVHCDFLAPTSRIMHLDNFVKPGVVVGWDGTDTSGVANCNATGIANYQVWYSTRVAGESEEQGGWVVFSNGNARSKSFTTAVADNTRVDFRVCATDNAGNVETACPNTNYMIVDTLAPTIMADELPQRIHSSRFAVPWKAIDNTSGPDNCKIKYRIDGGSWQEKAGELVNAPNQHQKDYRHQVVNGQHGQRYEFQIVCRDKVGHEQQGAVLHTTVWLKPDAGMDNITPNFVADQRPFTVAWHGHNAESASPVASFEVYFRQPGQPWQSMRFLESQVSATFPFDGSTPAPGLWEFAATATDQQGETPPLIGIAQATVVVGQAETGGMVYLPAVERQ